MNNGDYDEKTCEYTQNMRSVNVDVVEGCSLLK